MRTDLGLTLRRAPFVAALAVAAALGGCGSPASDADSSPSPAAVGTNPAAGPLPPASESEATFAAALGDKKKAGP